MVGLPAQGARQPDGGAPQCGHQVRCHHRPDRLDRGPAAGLGPDLVEGVRRLKAQDGPDLILAGSSTLTSPLFEHGLADALLLIVSPVLLGTGKPAPSR